MRDEEIDRLRAQFSDLRRRKVQAEREVMRLDDVADAEQNHDRWLLLLEPRKRAHQLFDRLEAEYRAHPLYDERH